jgi:hypothetical protein
MRTESEFLVDVLGRLNRAGVDYMLTGSMASNFWGTPRTTHDLDFVLVLQPDQVPKLVAEFETGIFIQPESVRGAFQPPHQFNALDEQSALKADFWLLRDDPFERTAFSRRLALDIFGVAAWVATAEDVLLHKLYWNRLTPSERQLLDAAGVYAVQAEALDMPYLLHWASILGVEQELNDLRSGKLKPKAT